MGYDCRMKILFMGGHELGKLTLDYLIEKGKNVVGVVMTDTEEAWYKGAEEVAFKYNIPLYKEMNINTGDFVSKVKLINPDLIISVNFSQLLKSEIIGIPPRGCINTHASLLPKYRGRAPLNWAIINGEKATGVTVHYINEGIDTGDIILQERINIGEEEYIGDLLEKVKKIYPKLVDEAIDMIEENRVIRTKQNRKEGCYCGKRTPKDGQIDWNLSAREIYNLIRAVSKPYPGAYTYVKDSKFTIWRASLDSKVPVNNVIPNGTIQMIDDGYMFIKVKDGVLKLESFEMAGEELDIHNLCLNEKLTFKED